MNAEIYENLNIGADALALLLTAPLSTSMVHVH